MRFWKPIVYTPTLQSTVSMKKCLAMSEVRGRVVRTFGLGPRDLLHDEAPVRRLEEHGAGLAALRVPGAHTDSVDEPLVLVLSEEGAVMGRPVVWHMNLQRVLPLVTSAKRCLMCDFWGDSICAQLTRPFHLLLSPYSSAGNRAPQPTTTATTTTATTTTTTATAARCCWDKARRTLRPCTLGGVAAAAARAPALTVCGGA